MKVRVLKDAEADSMERNVISVSNVCLVIQSVTLWQETENAKSNKKP